MIRGVVELSDTVVREIMVPRIDVVFVSLDMSVDELLTRIAGSRHSRLPVYAKTIDNVIGILHVKDMLQYLIKGKDTIDIQKIMRKAYFVPESKKLNTLLREFKKRKVHIAIVVDEYGGTSGVVCLEDVIEEIVGDIQDEFDNETEDILKIGEGIYLCDGRTNLEDLNEKLQLSLPENDFDSLGGFVFNLFGKIPVKYEKMTYDNNDFIIQDMNGHKILTVKIVMSKEKQENQKQGRDMRNE
ncbi:MAG: HlyC/CorC family transporter [Spirochaetales bacterium]|nr:HlyC/CorC family transporter [Spirochaetales bacterium]